MLLAPQARRLGVELSTRLTPDRAVLVGYRGRLKRAFLNVAVTPLEAMQEEVGRMCIETQAIPAALLARIDASDFNTKGGGNGTRPYAIDLPLVPLHFRH